MMLMLSMTFGRAMFWEVGAGISNFDELEIQLEHVVCVLI